MLASHAANSSVNLGSRTKAFDTERYNYDEHIRKREAFGMDDIEGLVRNVAGNPDCKTLHIRLFNCNPQFGIGDQLEFDKLISVTGTPRCAYADTVGRYAMKTWVYGDKLLKYFPPSVISAKAGR